MTPEEKAHAIIQSFGPQQTVSEIAPELLKLIAQDIEDASPKWQPIETAPEDGTEVLLSNEDDGYVEKGHYVAPAQMIEDEDDDRPDWFTTDGDYLGRVGESLVAPTVWMPLPEPPEKP